MPRPFTRHKKSLHLIERISKPCAGASTTLSTQAKELHQSLQKVMRRFGRQCRGQGKVFVNLVRQTEQHLLDLGESIETWTEQARTYLHQDRTRSQAQRERLLRELVASCDAHRHITKQSQ